MFKFFVTGVSLLGFVAFVQAADVPMGNFTAASTFNATLSNASSNEVTVTYATVPADTRAYVYSALNGGSQAIAIGESLEFSFDWSSTQIKNVSSSISAFSFGFDTGAGLFRVKIDTVPAFTFLNIGYGDTWQFGSTTTLSNFTVAANITPDSSAWLVAGNTPTIKTTLFRTAETDWTVSVDWGGQTYSASVAGYATDGTVDQVWIGSGDQTAICFDVGDNYMISNASVKLIEAFTPTLRLITISSN